MSTKKCYFPPMYILFEYVIDKIGDFKYWLKHLNDPEVVTNNNSCRCASHIFPNMETQKKMNHSNLIIHEKRRNKQALKEHKQ